MILRRDENEIKVRAMEDGCMRARTIPRWRPEGADRGTSLSPQATVILSRRIDTWPAYNLHSSSLKRAWLVHWWRDTQPRCDLRCRALATLLFLFLPPLLPRHPFDVKAGETISFLSTLRGSLSSSPSTISEPQRALSFVEDAVTGSNRAQFGDFLGIMTFTQYHTFPRSSINHSNFVVLRKYK